MIIAGKPDTHSRMDPRVSKVIREKIQEAILNKSEVSGILDKLSGISFSSKEDFAYGIAIGRIYNSFHYQTRRILKRNATEEEFSEFLDTLRDNAAAIRVAFELK